ncbi:MAG: NAD(P)H-dependent oxidoreductase subunit E, partial [Anaerolineales bacterium]
MEIEISRVDAIIDKYGMTDRGLIPSLLEIQDVYHYLPPEVLQRVAERLKIPAIRVHQVAEFYKAFSLEPRG